MKHWLAIFAFVSTPLWAHPENSGFSRSIEGRECPVQEDDLWTAQERWAWRKICRGEVADMRFAVDGVDDGQGCEAFPEDPGADPEPWPQTRELTASFFKQVVARSAWIDAPALPAVRIQCALFTESINLDNEVVPQTLWLDKSRIGSGISLIGTHFERYLAMDGSHLAGGLRSQGMVIAKDFQAIDSRFDELILLSADIGGNLTLLRSTVSGSLIARDAEIHGGVSINEMPRVGWVDLEGARIGQSVVASSSNLSNWFFADAAKIGSDLLLENMKEPGTLELEDAEIGGDLSLVGSNLSTFLFADGLRLEGDADLSEMESANIVFLQHATIGGSLHLQDTQFTSEVDLTHAEIQNTIWMAKDGMNPRWVPGSSLSLKNTDVGVLHSEMPQSWRYDESQLSDGISGLPLGADLNGLVYKNLEGPNVSSNVIISHREASDLLIGWIEGSRRATTEHETSYVPQPYTQLSKVLRELGADALARDVEFAKHLHRLESHEWGRMKVWDWAKFAFVGFGVRPYYAAYWFFGLVVVGVFVARCSTSLKHRNLIVQFWYSLENSIPLIDFSAGFSNINHGSTRGVASFFHFQKVAGFALATVLVGALTILGG